MPFDRELVEALLALDRILSSDWPKLALDALEAGADGPGIRRLAAFDSPTYFEVRDILPRAIKEMALAEITPGVAALRIAKNHAKEILRRGDDPLKHVHDFQDLWFESGEISELNDLYTMDDEINVGFAGQSDDEIRAWIIERLKKFVANGA